MTDNSLDTTTENPQQDEGFDTPSEQQSVAVDETTNEQQTETTEAPQDGAVQTEDVPSTELQAESTPEAPAATSEADADEVVDQTAVAVAVSEESLDEEADEEEEEDYFFAPGDWYVVHTYAGYENKVRANLSSRIQSMNMEDKIYDVVVPTEEVMELKSGKMQSVQKKVFPGYILVRMELDDDSWYVVRNTPGVTGFVGSGAKPTPLDPGEVSKILAPKTEERPRPKLDYEVGEVVSVVAGPFNGYSGPVNAIEVDKQQVTVLLDLFGRETPVELTFDQVTKL